MGHPEENSALLIYITVPTKEEALLIARSVIQEKLAACANILPEMTSVYEWRGLQEETAESVLVLKTSSQRYSNLETRILELHPYECPCIIAMPIERGYPGFLSWIKGQTTLGHGKE